MNTFYSEHRTFLAQIIITTCDIDVVVKNELYAWYSFRFSIIYHGIYNTLQSYLVSE